MLEVGREHHKKRVQNCILALRDGARMKFVVDVGHFQQRGRVCRVSTVVDHFDSFVIKLCTVPM